MSIPNGTALALRTFSSDTSQIVLKLLKINLICIWQQFALKAKFIQAQSQCSWWNCYFKFKLLPWSFFVFQWRNYVQGLSLTGLVLRLKSLNLVDSGWQTVCWSCWGVRKRHFHTFTSTALPIDARSIETNKITIMLHKAVLLFIYFIAM